MVNSSTTCSRIRQRPHRGNYDHRTIKLDEVLVLALQLTEATAKIRNGLPLDDEAAYILPV